MSLSRSKIVVLLMIMALFIAACGGGAATPTRPPATSAPEQTEAAAEDATPAAAEPTEETAGADATEETTEAGADATEEVAGADATEEATEAVAEATEAAEPTEEMTVEAAGGEATEEATEVAMEPTLEATEEATEMVAEATEENVIEVTLEVTDEATEEAMAEETEEAVVEATAEATEAADGPLAVTVQLQGEAQAGYPAFYVAADQGFYEDASLDVTLEANSEEVALAEGANFGVADVYSVLTEIEAGADIVIIGFLPRATMPDMSMMAEMTVEPLEEATMEADATAEVDAATGTDAMGSGYLAIYTSSEWLSEEGNEAVAVDFLRALILGWDYCAENSDECVDIVSASVPDAPQVDLDMITANAGLTLGDTSATIEAQWEAIVAGALANNVISEEPAADAVRIDLFIDALDSIADMGTDTDTDSSTDAEATAEATEDMGDTGDTGDMTEATAEATP